MPTKRLILILICAFPALGLHAQKALTFDIFSNATAMPTHPGQLFNPIHPGLTVGAEFRYNHNQTNQLGQTVKVGFFHHSLVQNGIQLYSEFHYNFQSKKRLGFDAFLGGGYIHSIPDHQIFKLNNGVYERKANWGKPEAMGTLSIGTSYLVSSRTEPGPEKARIFINYQFWLQTPFVNQYVPVLPNTALHVGIKIPLVLPPSPNYSW
jgi:hypothetical protein